MLNTPLCDAADGIIFKSVVPFIGEQKNKQANKQKQKKKTKQTQTQTNKQTKNKTITIIVCDFLH